MTTTVDLQQDADFTSATKAIPPGATEAVVALGNHTITFVTSALDANDPIYERIESSQANAQWEYLPISIFPENVNIAAGPTSTWYRRKIIALPAPDFISASLHIEARVTALGVKIDDYTSGAVWVSSGPKTPIFILPHTVSSQRAGEVDTAGQKSLWTGVREITEETREAQSAEYFMQKIDRALSEGAFTLAHRLAIEGAARHPTHHELKRYARVLAPPRVVRRDLPATSSVRANRDWLKKYGKNYAGRWVALRDGILVSVANTCDELVQSIEDTEGLLLTKIPQ